MLAGTAGVLGVAALASTAHAQTGAPAVPAASASAPPPSRCGEPAWWAKRKEEILEPALEIVDPHHHLMGSQRAPLSARPAAHRYRQRSQHHSQRLCRMRLNVPGRRPDRAEAGRPEPSHPASSPM